jgi:transcriptional regulator with XRE-family HTH domain
VLDLLGIEVDLARPPPNDTDQAQNRVVEERRARLRLALKSAGGNSEVARRAGIPLGSLNEYVAGREPRLVYAAALAKACNVSLEWLATGEGPMVRLDLPASGSDAGGLLRTINTDRLATAMDLIDRRLPAGADTRDRALAVVALYDIIAPMDENQVNLLIQQQK